MKKGLIGVAAVAVIVLAAAILWEAVFPFIGFVFEKVFAVPVEAAAAALNAVK